MNIKLRVGQVYLFGDRYRKITEITDKRVYYSWWDAGSARTATTWKGIGGFELTAKRSQLSKKHIINEFFNEIA